MIEFIVYTRENFPIETDLCVGAYNIVSRCVNIESESSEPVESKLHCVTPFYSPEPEENVRFLFGTIYNGKDYAAVSFSKSQVDKFGRLEVALHGEDKNKLIRIKGEISTEIEKKLTSKTLDDYSKLKKEHSFPRKNKND